MKLNIFELDKRHTQARVMQREKRQTKYVPKQQKFTNEVGYPMQNNWTTSQTNNITETSAQAQLMSYQPLCHQYNYNNTNSQCGSSPYMESPPVRHMADGVYHHEGTTSQRNHHQQRNRRKNNQQYDSQTGGRTPFSRTKNCLQLNGGQQQPGSEYFARQIRDQEIFRGEIEIKKLQGSRSKEQIVTHGFPMTGNMIAAVASTDNRKQLFVSQVKVNNDPKKNQFVNHPVNSFQANPYQNQMLQQHSAECAAVSHQSSADFKTDVTFSGQQFQQLQRQDDIARPDARQNEQKDGFENQIQIQSASQPKINYQRQGQCEPHLSQQVFVPTKNDQVQSLRFNMAASKAVQIPQSQNSKNDEANYVNDTMVHNHVPRNSEQFVQGELDQFGRQGKVLYHQLSHMKPNSILEPELQPQGYQTAEFTPMRLQNPAQSYHFVPDSQNYVSPYLKMQSQSITWQNSQRNMSFNHHQQHDRVCFQNEIIQPRNIPQHSITEHQSAQNMNMTKTSSTFQPLSRSPPPSLQQQQIADLHKSRLTDQQNHIDTSESPKKDTRKIEPSQIQCQNETKSVQLPDSTEKQKSKEHPETFQCLTSCTDWYLIAQVGNSQVKIPAKNTAVRFSDNPQELPILTKDIDLLENLVRQETQNSISETPVTQLNRPVNAGYNPSSSNNQSNNGYRRKENVIAAQKDYDKTLALNLVGDQKQDNQSKFPLHLPIQNGNTTAETRFVDLYMHHRTQQLMCLEFDVTHLKLDEVDSSLSGDYSDNFSLNPSSGDCVEPSQPTPFLGVPKTSSLAGSQTAYGQPSCVLYINEGNSVARQLRLINQDYVEGTTYFSLNGECHGKLVFKQDLKYSVQGKKVIKSVQDRLIRAKEHIYNEIIRIEPGVAVRQKSNSSGRNSKSRAPLSRSEQKTQSRPHKRSQKSVIGLLRARNKKNKGPFLRRPDYIHIPIVNVAKSLGFKMLMSNLASIDNMLTNFNQIVMQEGIIQSFFFSFDLPVHQLSTQTPTVSNSLVVKMPKDFITREGVRQSQQNQAAYIAYQQHRAAMMQGYNPLAQYQLLYAQPELQHTQVQQSTYQIQQQQYGSVQQQQQSLQKPQLSDQGSDSKQKMGCVNRHQNIQINANNDQNVSINNVQQSQPLWNLVDEFKRISTHGGPSSTNNQPAMPDWHQQPQQQQYDNKIECKHQPVQVAIMSPLSQQTHESASQVGQNPMPQIHPNATGQPQQLLMMQQTAQLSNQLQQVPHQLHQALYSIGNSFNPTAAPAFNADEGLGPTYVPPEDPNYFSNLDRLLEAITPRVSASQLESSTLHDFFKSFKRSSVFGLRVELLNEQTLQSEIFTFLPTLSSLVLSYTKPMIDSKGDRVNRILDFEVNDQNNNSILRPPVLPSDAVLQTNAADIALSQQKDTSISSISGPGSKSFKKFVEIHESEPYYSRPAFFSKIKEIETDIPHLKHVLLKPGSFKFESSWFSVLWTCQRVCQVPNMDTDSTNDQISSDAGADEMKMSCSAVSSIQFLAIFRFQPDPYLRNVSQNCQRGSKAALQRQPVELVGLMPYKYERESFWVSPCHLQTDNNLQGEMYDQICEDNIILLQDLKQRAIEFLQLHSNQQEYMHDFSYLLNSTNSSIFELFS